MHFSKKFGATIAVLFMGAVPAWSQAALTCSALNGQMGDLSGGNVVFAASLSAGDVVTITTTTPADVGVSIEQDGGSDSGICNVNFGPSCANFAHTAAATDTYTIEAFPLNTPTSATFNVACSAGGGSTGGNAGGQAQTQAAQASQALGNAQAGALSGALGNAMGGRLGGGTGPVATRNQLFLSTANVDDGDGAMYVWGSINASRFFGDVDGNSIDLLLGADMQVGPDAFLGAVLGYGTADLDTDSGLSIDADTFLFGPYFATRFGSGLILETFLVYARPDYSVSGSSFSADRYLGSVQVSGEYALGTTLMRPYLGLSGYSERQPARTIGGTAFAATNIRNYAASIGTMAEFDPAGFGGTIAPYISVGIDLARSEDGFGNNSSYVAPQLGFGLSTIGGAGTFSLDVTAAQLAEDVRGATVGLRYDMSF